MGIYINRPIFGDTFVDAVMQYSMHIVHRRGQKLCTVHSGDFHCK